MAGIMDGSLGIICGSTISELLLFDYFSGKISLSHVIRTVSKTVAVSAAHCFAGRNVTNMTIVVAEHDIGNLTESLYTKQYPIAKVMKHEQYDGLSSNFDIALVLPTSSFSFNNAVGPSCLPISWVLSLFSFENFINLKLNQQKNFFLSSCAHTKAFAGRISMENQ